MDYKEKATILRVCSSKKGERCSRCPAFGQGSRVCMRNAMKDGATAITDLLDRAKAAENERDALKARFCAEDPCKNCNHYASHFPGCDDDCLKCQKECPCNQCCEYSMWEWNGQKEE